MSSEVTIQKKVSPKSSYQVDALGSQQLENNQDDIGKLFKVSMPTVEFNSGIGSRMKSVDSAKESMETVEDAMLRTSPY